MHRTVSRRRLLPGALLASVTIGGATATSPLFLGGWLHTDGEYFGSFGVVIGLLARAFVLVRSLWRASCFSPVWAEWRRAEKQLRVEQPAGTPVSPEAG